ncbi:MAG TPA: hypothetical protein VFT31_16745 [Kribbella sp.]|nr:hypothetical protein [Kribbella sp.]
MKTCTSPSFSTYSNNNVGDGRTFGSYYVHNNMWNNDNGQQWLNACNYDNWYVIANQPNDPENAVKTYPNVHKDYADAPLSRIVSSRFAANSPRCAGCIYNVAYDIWIGDGFSNELMIWTENWGQRPAGSLVDSSEWIGGQEYEVWRAPGGQDIMTFVSKVPQLSGTMPLQEFFKNITARGWIPADSTTWQVDYGVEIVDTNGTNQRFNFTDFSITETS